MTSLGNWKSLYRTGSAIEYVNKSNGKRVIVIAGTRMGEPMLLLPGTKRVRKSSRTAAINFAHEWMRKHPRG